MDGKQKGELVAADPAEIILVPDDLPCALREGAQHLVAGNMAVAV